jgi:hypothetical protein
VTEILTEPVSAPSVWRGDELADAGRWSIRFTEEDFADFERALAHVSEAAIIYWGMGRHLGNLVPQNRKGDLVGHIKDLGRRGPRTAFVDDAENPARQRHLLRLWISRPEAGRPLCPEYAAWRSGYPT